VHTKNARTHIARLSVELFEDIQIKTAPRALYSPDIASFDFYLFGYAKGCLAGRSFVDSLELFEGLRGILGSIEKVILQAVFLEWMDRLKKCIQTNGEYIR
jgi:hypothetical protein